MSAGISQQFCVRWNSHLGSLGAAFPQLLAGQRFVDVTLACEGHQVHCHRLVLAACSTYFESLLGENPCKHPIIILPRDIKLWEIQALVDFMYKGEVNVSQAGLPDLLKCAEILQIRGLCGSDATLNLNNITSGQQSMAGNTPLSSSSTSSSSSSSIGGASVSSITHSSHNVTATNATTTSATLTTTTSSSTSTLLGSSVVPAGSLTNSSSSSSSSAAAAVASLSSSVLAASTASGSGATNLNSNQTRNGGGGANGNKIIISCGQQQQSQIANNNQCSISSTAAGNNGGNGLDISSSTQITNILRNELMNPSIKFSTGQQSSSTSASSINASAAIITTPTASIEDGDDSANGSSNELNIKCEEMDDSDGKMRDDYADDMDGPGKLQAEFAMANVTCEYDSLNTQTLDGNTPGRRIRRSETLLRQAAECVSHGQTFQTVSDMFHIPISTIRFFMARKGILPRRKRGRASGAPIISGDATGNLHNNRDPDNARRSASPSEPPFHFVNYKLPNLKHELL